MKFDSGGLHYNWFSSDCGSFRNSITCTLHEAYIKLEVLQKRLIEQQIGTYQNV
jgi:hypothetical protein